MDVVWKFFMYLAVLAIATNLAFIGRELHEIRQHIVGVKAE